MTYMLIQMNVTCREFCDGLGSAEVVKCPVIKIG